MTHPTWPFLSKAVEFCDLLFCLCAFPYTCDCVLLRNVCIMSEFEGMQNKTRKTICAETTGCYKTCKNYTKLLFDKKEINHATSADDTVDRLSMGLLVMVLGFQNRVYCHVQDENPTATSHHRQRISFIKAHMRFKNTLGPLPILFSPPFFTCPQQPTCYWMQSKVCISLDNGM